VGRPAEVVDPDELMGREVLPTLRAGDRGVIKSWQKIDGSEEPPAPSSNGGNGVKATVVTNEEKLPADDETPAAPPSTNGGVADAATAAQVEGPSPNIAIMGWNRQLGTDVERWRRCGVF
jgi:hypothetical protein